MKAEFLYWDSEGVGFDWSTAGTGGNWQYWSGAWYYSPTAPSSIDTVLLGYAETPTIVNLNSGAFAYEVFAKGSVTLNLQNKLLDIDAGFQVSDGTLHANSGTIAARNFDSVAGATAHLTDVTLNTSGPSRLGSSSGSGTVNLSTGGVWNSLGRIYVGDTGGTGSLNLTSSSSRLTATGLSLGSNGGVGSLSVSSGAVVTTGFLEELPGQGTVTLNGGTLRAGQNNVNFLSGFEVGDVTIGSGGAFLDTNGYAIGISSSLSGSGSLTKLGAGTLTLSGSNTYTGGTIVKSGTLNVVAGGVINHSGTNVSVGDQAGNNGSLLLSGGLVSGKVGFIGYAAGSVGSATVTSGTWTNTGVLSIGERGTGSLSVNGGLVTNAAGYVGAYATANGSVAVTSGTWANSGNLYAGDLGQGTLVISGGLLSNATGYLGYLAGSRGSATVSSGTWNNSGDLNVGNSGTGLLTITGGLVTADTSWIGSNVGASGTVSIFDGVWNNSNNLRVGQSGTGTLQISGGQVINRNALLGTLAGSRGSAIVSGGTWTNSANLYVGASGTGSLTVSGGLVVVSGTAFTGTAAGSRGTITLNSGTLSTMRVMEGSGAGDLIFNGGTIQARVNESDFLSSYEAGELMINEGGAFIDTNGYNIGISAPFAGGGMLTKLGAGTLTLGGSSSNNNYLTVAEGNVNLGKSGSAYAAAYGLTVLAGGTATLTGSSGDQILYGRLEVDGTFNLNGLSEADDYLYGSGTVRNGHASTTSTLTVEGGNFSGNILNGGAAALSLVVDSQSVLRLSGSNSYSGVTRIWDTSVVIFDGADALSANSNLRLSGGVAGITGNFTRALGTGAGQVRLENGSYSDKSGFAAYGGTHTVNIGGAGATLTRGTNFLNSGGILTFGSLESTGTVDFVNPINLGGSDLLLAASYSDLAERPNALQGILSGVLSNGTGLEISSVWSGGGVSSSGYNLGFIRLAADNTFDGQIFVDNAGIEVDRIGNVGSGAGPLGLASTANKGLIFLADGAFRYTGTGHSTNRDFVVDDFYFYRGAAIVADGSGALKLTGGAYTYTSTNGGMLVFGGTSTAANEFSGVIYATTSGQNAARVDLEKQDSGTWILSGTHSVESLTVRGGLLDLRGTTYVAGSTPVTAAQGGILRIGQGALSAPSFLVESGGTLQYESPLDFTDSLALTIDGYGVDSQGAVRAISGTTTRTATTTVKNFNSASINADVGATLIFDTVIGPAVSGSGATLSFGGGGTIIVKDAIWLPNATYFYPPYYSFPYDGRFGYVGTGLLALEGGADYKYGYIGSTLGSGTMGISGGLVRGDSSYIGNSLNENGTVSVTSGTWKNNSSLYVGYSGTGTLAISGGEVSQHTAFVGGLGVTGHGRIEITGGTFTSTNFYLGAGGRGEMALDAGLVSNSNAHIGGNSLSSGTATISGGTWNTANQLHVGANGRGVLAINGGLVSALNATVGSNAGGDGAISVSSGTLQVQNSLIVGQSGTGRMTINSGLVSSGDGQIGNATGTDGAVVVNGGTWAMTNNLTVGSSLGSLAINSGLVSNTVGIIANTSGTGVVTVGTSGTWRNSASLYVGYSGSGALNVAGGYVEASGTTTAAFLGGQGAISIYHGTLSTSRIVEGAGAGSIYLAGGILQARGNESDFLSGFESGDIFLDSVSGGIIDTQGYTVGISSPFAGTGELTKIGAGALTLTGSSSYGGGTVIADGTLAVGHDSALGGGGVRVDNGATLSILSGMNPANPITLAGGTLSRQIGAGTNLAGSIEATSYFVGGAENTTSDILAGASSAATSVVATFSGSSAASNDEIRSSDVLHLSGIALVSGQSTDLFVLELSMTDVEPGSYLGWLNGSNEWVNAAIGNTGNNADLLTQTNYEGTFAEFQAEFGTNLSAYVGAWGFTETGVWTVLNHNSDFAVVGTVPEPTTGLLILFGTAALALRRRRR